MKARGGLLLLTLAASSCAPSVGSVARQASRAAIDEGADQLAQEDTQKNLAQAAKDPELQAAAAAMAQELTRNILDGLSGPESREQIAALATTVAQSAAREFTAALNTPETRTELVALTSAATQAALSQSARSLRDDFRPVFAEMIRDDVARGMAIALQSQVQPVLGSTAQTVAYHAVLGANDGLDTAWSEPKGLLADLRGVSDVGRFWFWAAAVLLGILTVLVISLAVIAVARARRAGAEVARLESTTLLLATAMRERQQPERSDEIVAIVQQALEAKAERNGRRRILGALRMR